jgi:hypothetical protein
VVASAHLLLEAGSTVATVLLVAEAIPQVSCLLVWTEASHMRREDVA